MSLRDVKIFRSRIAVYAVLLIVGGLLWMIAEKGKGPESGKSEEGKPAQRPPQPDRNEELPPGLKEDLSADYLKGYGAPDSDPVRDLVLVKDVIDAYSYSIKVPDALPTSGNRDITTALLGDNAYKIRFVDPGFAYLSAEGELLDRWRTPFYFHFEEATDPAIRSAGPDRKMWTADDLVLEE